MKTVKVFTLCLLGILASGFFGMASEFEAALVENVKIWDRAEYNSFVDLVRFKETWFCTFREGEHHVYGEDGRIRVIKSDNGADWVSAVLLAEDGVDLRDPKITVTPDGRLMLVIGGSVYDGKTLASRQPRVAFSGDGTSWTPLRPILEKGDWLWRVTWFGETAYGVSYLVEEPDWIVNLYKSSDGVEYELVTQLQVPDSPNETTLRFTPKGEMMALVRRESGSKTAWIGMSAKAPYTEWNWKDSGYQIGGPNFLILPNESIWASGRGYGPGKLRSTMLARITEDMFYPVLNLPSGKDTSYPGMVWHQGLLWMAYYSSHEGKACIYLAKIRLPE